MQKSGVYMLLFPFCGLGRGGMSGDVCLFFKPTGEYLGHHSRLFSLPGRMCFNSKMRVTVPT